MLPQISDYAILGDTRTAALVSREGSIDWLCWPRFDSPALFLRILDERRGGACSVAFTDLRHTHRRYLPDTNVLETSFVTASGRAVLHDFMPVNPPSTLADEGPDSCAESRVIRILSCEEGTIQATFRTRPTFDYARCPCVPVPSEAGSILFDAGAQRLRVTASHPLTLEDDSALTHLHLRAGERAYLVLTHGEDGQAPPIEGPDAITERLQSTTHYWQDWSRRCEYRGPYREAVVRSALCLKLLTYAPTGSIVAAPTTGLPEAIPGNRNFDYRFTWIRDASFTLSSFLNLGYVREADEFLRFLRSCDDARHGKLHLMYAIDGEVLPEERLDHLQGYRGAHPVLIGNDASNQHQYDIYGEFLSAFHAYLARMDDDPPERVRKGLPEALAKIADHAMASRHEPDHGIWELRTGKKHFLHTKAMLWVALDCAAKIARKIDHVDEDRIAAWERAAAEIRAEYHERGWNPTRGAYTQAYDSELLDASVLRLPLFDALDPHDPRLTATLAAIERELGCGDGNDLTYRYRMPDGFEGDEGAFLVCSFWRLGCLALAGHTRPAQAYFERLLAKGNDLGLFSEEIDPATGEARGNFPQAFTHMAVINHAIRLEKCIARFGLRD
ncbi:Glucoamylase [Chondromyces apiculatus DSM 436]|uniref:Glucoamylase n=1 Tax=Chondromyces apiculatus DSM 436 TaxID=1192034 RepID=A0A017SV82_9BACT|nr:Glucoamylase [Chondromyces apiculatus DSM 436]